MIDNLVVAVLVVDLLNLVMEVGVLVEVHLLAEVQTQVEVVGVSHMDLVQLLAVVAIDFKIIASPLILPFVSAKPQMKSKKSTFQNMRLLTLLYANSSNAILCAVAMKLSHQFKTKPSRFF